MHAMCTNDSDMANDSEQQLTQLSILDEDQQMQVNLS